MDLQDKISNGITIKYKHSNLHKQHTAYLPFSSAFLLLILTNSSSWLPVSFSLCGCLILKAQ